ncbi:MAG: hypothetical protein KIT73_08035 [Burkholderiales bacterium]|nr:hypothetical protein [Burkholderiales bacterium]
MRWHPFLSLIVLGLVACSSVTVKNTWRAPDAQERHFHRLLVVGVSTRIDVRNAFEDGFAAALRTRGVQADASYPLLPEMDTQSPEAIRAVAGKGNYDGVIVTRLVRREARLDATAPVPGPMPFSMNLYGYYPQLWTGYYEPPTVLSYEVAVLETTLYGHAGGDAVWAATSEVFDPGDYRKNIDDFAKVVGKALVRDRML